MAGPQTLDTRPQTVDILHYAGDTLSITITAPSGVVASMVWKGQIRSSRDAVGVDAEFVITPNSSGATVVLPSSVCAELASTGVTLRGSALQRADPQPWSPRITGLQRYSGVYDVQVGGTAGAEPVRTLVQGVITIDMDVSRA